MRQRSAPAEPAIRRKRCACLLTGLVMSEHDDLLERHIHRFALTTALLLTLSIPFGYGLVSYRDYADSLDFKARVKASTLSALVASNPDTWMFAENHLQGLLSREPVPLDAEFVQIIDQGKALVTQFGLTLPAPLLKRSYPLYDGARAVGQVVVAGTLRPLLWSTLLSALLGLLLSALVYGAMRTLPLSALRTATANLRASERRFRLLFENTPGVAVQGYDANCRVIYWNKASERLYGYSAEEAIGRDLNDLIIPPAMCPAIKASIAAWVDGGPAISASELILQRKNGSLVTVFSSHTLLMNASGQPELFCIDIDLTERKGLEDALRRRESYQRAVFDNFPFRVWLKDKQSRYLGVNQAFADACAWPSPESLDRKTDLDIYSPELAGKLRADDQWVLTSGSSQQIEELLEIDGQNRWFETYKSPIAVDGHIIGVVGFSRDISQFKQTEVALETALASAEKANRDKSRFLAAASHDLRQPLSALSLYVGVLENRVSPDNVELVGSIKDCVVSLSELLRDLLDVSKLDAKVVVPNLSSFAIDDELAALVSVHSAEAELKGLRLHFRKSGAIVRTDQTLLRRILSNLIANAIGFTRVGGVLIACRNHQGTLWVEVWDTGIGIAEHQIGIIFDEFKQLGDGARTRGSGLGLAIVDKAAKLLKLQLRVRSRPGRGSMFAVELPRGRIPAAAAPKASRLTGRRLRIALVDDNEKLRQALLVALEGAGHEVLGAASGTALLAALGQGAPDIVISDYRLAAKENGFDVIKAVRDRFGQDLPAFLITGDTDPTLIRSMADRGIAVHYKPFQIDALRGFINQATERRSP
jgi:PAS domain S-box-containing protein